MKRKLAGLLVAASLVSGISTADECRDTVEVGAGLDARRAIQEAGVRADSGGRAQGCRIHRCRDR